MTKSNHLLGDMVFVNMQGFKGYARVSGVENKRDGIYYYLTSGPDSSRTMLYAHDSEVQAYKPIATNKQSGSIFLAGKVTNERN